MSLEQWERLTQAADHKLEGHRGYFACQLGCVPADFCLRDLVMPSFLNEKTVLHQW